MRRMRHWLRFGRSRRLGSLRRYLPLVLLAGACLLAAAGLSCCGDGQTQTVDQRPLSFDGVPTIRVRLMEQPAASVDVYTTGGYKLTVDSKLVSESRAPLAATKVTRQGNTWQFNNLAADGDVAVIEPSDGSYISINGTTYRGIIRLLAAGGGCVAVNYVDMESYVAGVLPRELYPNWHPQTYRALAVAARTFAMYHMTTFGKSHTYDLGDTQASQVYGGFTAETDKSWQAVQQTHGEVLAYGPSGRERIFMAQYSAACGGLVNGAYVIQNSPSISPLVGGQTCTDCEACPRYRWASVQIAKHDIYKALLAAYASTADLTAVSTINIISTAPGERMVWVDVVGPNGKSIRVRAEDIRVALLRSGNQPARKLYSMNCRIIDRGDSFEFVDGRGFGHGAGMCQWGAQGKALKDWQSQEIVEFYYPGAKIIRAY